MLDSAITGDTSKQHTAGTAAAAAAGRRGGRRAAAAGGGGGGGGGPEDSDHDMTDADGAHGETAGSSSGSGGGSSCCLNDVQDGLCSRDRQYRWGHLCVNRRRRDDISWNSRFYPQRLIAASSIYPSCTPSHPHTFAASCPRPVIRTSPIQQHHIVPPLPHHLPSQAQHLATLSPSQLLSSLLHLLHPPPPHPPPPHTHTPGDENRGPGGATPGGANSSELLPTPGMAGGSGDPTPMGGRTNMRARVSSYLPTPVSTTYGTKRHMHAVVTHSF